MCEITEEESLSRRLESLAVENERLRDDVRRLRSELAVLNLRFDAACEIADDERRLRFECEGRDAT